MATNYSPKVVTDGLVLHLDSANGKSYPGSGNTWYDLSGNGNNGTNSNVVYSSNNEGIFEFNNTSSVSTIPNSPSLNPTEGLTIEAWVMFYGNDNDFIYEKGNVNTQHSLFSHGGGTNDIRFRTYHDGVRNDLFFNKTTEGFTTNTWWHIVATYNRVNKILYLNGIQKAISNETRLLQTTTPGASVGRFGGTTTGYYFGGRIPKVAVYNRALTLLEIQQNFNATRSRFGV